ncbi:hypothetical protein niasHS_018185 [Heterodera schachtii]|uniref:DNA primase n=1 Tax=Heterodera schachtii TaxID=97005 RepID=A0ABD2HX41_HETSC
MDLTKLEPCLKEYYLNCYPYDLIFKWLSYSNKNRDYLSKREFAFIIKGLKRNPFLRFLSFVEPKEFIVQLRKTPPQKIDLGAVYNRPPRDREKIGEFFPVERELVFDIDLNDYDTIRQCCKDKSVCKKCWRWITIAVDVLEHLLRTHFGFQHLLWVFSGRRGIHCWVADKKARALSSRGREAIVKYLTFNKDGSSINKYRVHPFVTEAYRKIMESGDFEQLIMEQGWLDTADQWNSTILAHWADKSLAELLDKGFSRLQTPKLRWESMKLRFDDATRINARGIKLPPTPSDEARRFFISFVMEFAYPKLDANVTAGLNHLLKSPFSVHPQNGNVAVPLSAKEIRAFDPNVVPRIDKLVAQIASLRESSQENKENQRSIVYRQTSLAPHIAVFEQWTAQILNSEGQK